MAECLDYFFIIILCKNSKKCCSVKENRVKKTIVPVLVTITLDKLDFIRDVILSVLLFFFRTHIEEASLSTICR